MDIKTGYQYDFIFQTAEDFKIAIQLPGKKIFFWKIALLYRKNFLDKTPGQSDGNNIYGPVSVIL